MQKIDATDKHVEKVCAGVAAAAAHTESLLDNFTCGWLKTSN